jgi:hypothetical protein
MEPSRAYSEYCFHGPTYQLLTRLDGISAEGVDAQVRPSDVAAWVRGGRGDWLFDPGLVDAALQTGLIWSGARGGNTVLPSRFGSIERYRSGPTAGPLRLVMRILSADDLGINTKMRLFDGDGRLVFRMEEIAGTISRRRMT